MREESSNILPFEGNIITVHLTRARDMARYKDFESIEALKYVSISCLAFGSINGCSAITAGHYYEDTDITDFGLIFANVRICDHFLIETYD